MSCYLVTVWGGDLLVKVFGGGFFWVFTEVKHWTTEKNVLRAVSRRVLENRSFRFDRKALPAAFLKGFTFPTLQSCSIIHEQPHKLQQPSLFQGLLCPPKRKIKYLLQMRIKQYGTEHRKNPMSFISWAINQES